jgi:[ribosomal protein S5]-alanine N-acetyltransferase
VLRKLKSFILGIKSKHYYILSFTNPYLPPPLVLLILTSSLSWSNTEAALAGNMAVSTPPNGPWTFSSYPQHSLHPMSLALFGALEAGDLGFTSPQAPASLPPLPSFLISTQNRGIWRRRLDLVAADPEQLPWVSRLVVYEPKTNQGAQNPDLEAQEANAAMIVGRIGFHGKPDERGMVEVGYEIDPAHRGRGHVKAAMRIMVDIARRTQGVNVLRASVAPENWISRRVVEGEGLRKIGREVHERRGLEDIFEIDVSK